MKKHFAFLTATLLAMTLGACNTTGTSTSVSTSVTTSASTSSVEASTSSDISSSLTTSSTSSSISSSSSSVSSTSSGPKEVQIGEFYESRTWDESIVNMTKTVLGDYWEKVPVFLATRYEAYMNFNDGGVLTFQIRCFGVNGSSATRLYKEKMTEYGYYFSAESNYGYQMVDYYSDLFLAYAYEDLDDLTIGTPFFVIQANIQQTREVAWNSVIVDLYADITGVPACPAESYSTSYDNSKDTLTVFALFVDRNTVMSKYINELYKVGFTIKSTDQYGTTTLIDESGYLTVQLYLTYGDYDCDALYIHFVNAWPSVPIASFINLAQFPKLVSDTALYDGYTYIDPVGNNNEKDFTLCVYYKSASTTDYENYVSSVINLGFTKGQVETSDTGIISTYLNALVPFSETSVAYVTVRVLYQISTSTICIVFYQANLTIQQESQHI